MGGGIRRFSAIITVLVLAIAGLAAISASATAAVDACDAAVSAITKAAQADSTASDIKDAVAALGDADPSACAATLRTVKTERVAASRRALEIPVTPAYSLGDAVSAALLLDPRNEAAAAAAAADSRAACAHVNDLIDERRYDDARQLAAALAGTGDDDTKKCASAAQARLADQTEGDKRGTVARLEAFTTDVIVSPLLAVAALVLLALLLWRAVRAVRPLSPQALRLQRRCAPWAARVAVALGALAVGALVDAYVEAPLRLGFDVTACALGLSLGSAAGLAVVMALVAWRTSHREWPLLVLWILGLAVLLGGGLLAAHALDAETPWLHLALGAGAAVATAVWAGSNLRVSLGKLSGSGTSDDVGAAVTSAYGSMTQGSMRVVTFAASAAPVPSDVTLTKLPGGPWIAPLVTAWRAITPSSDLTLTGTVLDEGEKAQRLSLTLIRGRRPVSAVSVPTSLFWVDRTKPTDFETAAIPADLATAAAAWLMFALLDLTGEREGQRLDGARHWEGVALTHVALRRSLQGHKDAANVLVHRALEADASNQAAEYTRLAAIGTGIDGAKDGAVDLYEATAEAISDLVASGSSDMSPSLEYRCRYMSAALRLNAAVARWRSPGVPPDHVPTVIKVAAGFRDLVNDIDRAGHTFPLGMRLTDLSRAAGVCAAVVAGFQDETARKIIAELCSKECPDADAADKAVSDWALATNPELRSPDVAYNAACALAWQERRAGSLPAAPSKELRSLLQRALGKPAQAQATRHDPFFSDYAGKDWFVKLVGREDDTSEFAQLAFLSPFASVLVAHGVTTRDQLRGRTATGPKRTALANGLGHAVAATRLAEWHGLLELARDDGPGVPLGWIDALDGLGIRSLTALGSANSTNLERALAAVAAADVPPREPPSLVTIESWIQASA